jgi:hypothetical protein
VRNVFCVASPQTARSFCGIARDAMGCEPVLLETKSELAVRENDFSIPELLFPLTPSIGTAIQAL